MLPKLSLKERIEIVEQALLGESVGFLSRKHGISRILLYKWINNYKNYGKKGLLVSCAGRKRKPRNLKKYSQPREY